MSVLTGAKYFDSNKGVQILYGTTGATNQDTTPDGKSIPDGSLYVLLSPPSLWQKILGEWVQVNAGNVNIVATSVIACNPSVGTDTYTTTAIPTPISGYDTNVFYQIPITIQNTGASTINIDGRGALPWKKLVGGILTDLVSGDLPVATYFIYYDGTNAIIQTGKESILYDNNGNPIIIGVDGNLYFIQPVISGKLSDYSSHANPYSLLFLSKTGQVRKANINYANTLFVDPDGTNVGYATNNPLQPYITVTGANAYITPGETSLIYINNGLYNSDTGELFKNNVNYFLQKGVIFDGGAATTSAAGVTINVSGYGEIRKVISYTANSIVNIICDFLRGNGSNNIVNASGSMINITSFNITQNVKLTNCIFNIQSRTMVRNGGNSSPATCIEIIGGSGVINTDNVSGNFSDGVNPVVNVSGACGDVFLNLGIVAAYDDSGTLLKNHPNVINISNSSGIITIDVGIIYGAVILAPTGSGKVRLTIKGILIANISVGSPVTINPNCTVKGICQNMATNTGSGVVLVASNAGGIFPCVQEMVAIGGEYSIRATSALSVLVAGYLNKENATNNITEVGAVAVPANVNFANI